MNTLIIDSSNKQAKLALITEDKSFLRFMDENKSHSEFLLQEIEDFLIENNLKIQDINCFSINVGPGSFTGVRIGLSFVKAFMCSLNCKAVTINNFELVSESIINKPEKYFVVLSSNNCDFYYAKFEKDCIKYGFSNVENFNNLLNKENLNVYCINDEINMFGELKNVIPIILKNESLIVASLNKINNNQFSNVQEISPLYIKKSQAEIGLQNKINENLVIKNNCKIEELVNLEEICFSSEKYNKDSLISDLNNKNIMQFYAYFNDELIGYINFECIIDEINLFKICVLPEFRQYGVATKLMEHMIIYATQNSIKKIFLEVDNKNFAAITLYEKFKFKKISERKNYYKNGNDALIYELTL